ncbi:GNAT family N-acetyltransferase [Micromonospora sp. NPDC000207]|uniref:GNAT family N-acetyltransferase n=1 Tax=Micromonospora sp. NPDC000207 TaxID=3154246 RepID=UPI003325A012
MLTTDQVLTGRAALLEAAGHHPYARHGLRRGSEVRGYRHGGAVAWLPGPGPGPAGNAVGSPDAAVEIFVDLVAAGVVHPGQWLHLPGLDPGSLAGRLAATRVDQWEFRWADAPPPDQTDQDRVVRLGEADGPSLTELIDVAFPTTTSRPGDPRIVDWYGIRDGDRLVAAGADRSQGDIGFVAGLVVAPGDRGRGLGAALTAGMARRLFDRYDQVALGVYTDNVGAIRLYERLGFRHVVARSSVRLAED